MKTPQGVVLDCSIVMWVTSESAPLPRGEERAACAGMVRLTAVSLALLASSAFATGERITVTGAAQALTESLCISMSCVDGGARDFAVNGKPVKAGIEITVISSSGQSRFSQVVALNADGHISSTDVMKLTAQVFKAIEEGPVAASKLATPNKAVAEKKALKKAYARR